MIFFVWGLTGDLLTPSVSSAPPADHLHVHSSLYLHSSSGRPLLRFLFWRAVFCLFNNMPLKEHTDRQMDKEQILAHCTQTDMYRQGLESCMSLTFNYLPNDLTVVPLDRGEEREREGGRERDEDEMGTRWVLWGRGKEFQPLSWRLEEVRESPLNFLADGVSCSVCHYVSVWIYRSLFTAFNGSAHLIAWIFYSLLINAMGVSREDD